MVVSYDNQYCPISITFSLIKSKFSIKRNIGYYLTVIEFSGKEGGGIKRFLFCGNAVSAAVFFAVICFNCAFCKV